jgi:predicted dehydrogenase
MGSDGRVSRRGFLKGAATAGVAIGFPTIIPASALGADGHVAPSERVVVGCIGVGQRGGYLMRSALELPEAQVVAVCDVKKFCRDEAASLVNDRYETSDCGSYLDFQELVAREDIDACLIGSCDHWHVLHALAATRAGKGVYLEKPMGVTVEENQALRKAVRHHETVFQFGTQQRSNDKFRKACEIVRNKLIGDLKTVYVWSPASVSGGPTELAPIPEYLDYERWLGPAPDVPYTFERDTNKWWWFIDDYAVGFIAGWGIHPMDIALWGAHDLMRTPVTISGTGTFPTDGLCNTATEWDINLAFDSGVNVRFHSQPAPEEWSRYGLIRDHGTVFEGTDGWVLVDRSYIRSSDPELVDAELPAGAARLPERDHHMQDFIHAVRAGKDPIAPIESAVEGDNLCQISDIAIRLKRPLRWDPAQERFVDDAEANARLTRPMRGPWHL